MAVFQGRVIRAFWRPCHTATLHGCIWPYFKAVSNGRFDVLVTRPYYMAVYGRIPRPCHKSVLMSVLHGHITWLYMFHVSRPCHMGVLMSVLHGHITWLYMAVFQGHVIWAFWCPCYTAVLHGCIWPCFKAVSYGRF